MLHKILALILIPASSTLFAQHEHHGEKKDTVSHRNHHPAADTMPDHSRHSMATIPMSHAFSLHLPMTRNGSGTAWLPDESPMYGSHDPF
jgi:hypothetical protein